MQIASSAFQNSERIPEKYTCDGEHFLSPPLSITNVPETAQSLVLIVDDPDVPKTLRADGNFTHWVVFNISPTISLIREGEVIGTLGTNTRGESRYTGPCPPTEYEPSTHRYFFKLYALDTTLDLEEGASKENVEDAVHNHIIATAEIIGTYSRIQPSTSILSPQ
jgi:Raf kinase inhibitor-like YbhB/YbcL family protein